MNRCLSPVLLAATFWSAAAAAAPVDSAGLASEADPVELAQRWTLAGAGMLAPPAPALPPQRDPARVTPPPGLSDGTVPDPASYALVGLGLLVLGVAAQRFKSRRGRGAQRGFSKNT